jgi:hypothetical protein
MSTSMPDLMSLPDIGIDTTGAVPATSSGDISAPSPSPSPPSPTPSKDAPTGTAAPKSSSDTSAPTSSPAAETTSTSKLEAEAEAEADGDGVISDIQGSGTSSSSGVTPGQTAMIVLVVCAALTIGLVVLRRNLLSRSSSSSCSVSSGSDGPSQADDSVV